MEGRPCERLSRLTQRALMAGAFFCCGFSCVSVCADNNHVRTWTVTRFRGMISTQPGSTPLASFKILSLEETESHGSYCSGNDIGKETSAVETRRKGGKDGAVGSGTRCSMDLYAAARKPFIPVFRSVWGERRSAGVHTEGDPHHQQAVCEALVHREEVHLLLTSPWFFSMAC